MVVAKESIEMYRILIADDHPLFRRGVKEILQDGFNGATIGEAANVQEMLDRVRQESWDAVVMDITMPGKSGTGALRDLKSARPMLPVIILTMHPEEQYAVRMFKAGANGYVTKATFPVELIQAMKTILSGGRYITPKVADSMACYLNAPRDHPSHQALSDREFQVLKLLAHGKSISAIGEELAVSITTVSTYRARILEKMQMTNRAELIRYAVEHGLVD
jgi:two-component system invasion response regulator UvrY